MWVRFIHQIKADLYEEIITFTEDYDTPSREFLYSGFEILRDMVIDLGPIPDSFPVESSFKKIV